MYGPSRRTHARDRTGHIIEDISFRENYILCICSWKGSREDFVDHQKSAPKIPRKESENTWARLYSKKLAHPPTEPIRNFNELGSLEKDNA